MSDKSLSVVGLIIAIIAIFTSLLVPEIRRNIFGLDKNKPNVEIIENSPSEELKLPGGNLVTESEGITANCLNDDIKNDSLFYLRVIIDNEINNTYSGIITSGLKRHIGNKEIELLRSKINPNQGLLFEYSISVSDKETEAYIETEEDLSSLKTVEILGNLICTNLKEGYLVSSCDVSTKLAVHKLSPKLNRIIHKSLQSL